MRWTGFLLFAPLALAACGGDDRPVVVNTPPSAVVTPAPTAPTAPNTTVVVPEKR
jgi:hypothetical protein